LRPRLRPWVRRFAVVSMIAAVLAFTFEGTFIATAAVPAPQPSHQHHSRSHTTHQDHGHSHSGGQAKAHVVTHVHADGTVHRHAVDDENGGLARHMKERGSASIAPGIAVLPSPSVLSVSLVAGRKLAIEPPTPFRGIEPDGPRKPPRPPSIV